MKCLRRVVTIFVNFILLPFDWLVEAQRRRDAARWARRTGRDPREF
jgi:hypothetical protein